MDRRETIKSLLVGTVAGGFALSGCSPAVEGPQEQTTSAPGYGRTAEEEQRDRQLKSETYFTEPEMASIAVLCDIILPATADFSSATENGVPEFIEFMAKDIPSHQLPIRGGLMWLDHRANEKYNRIFADCSADQQLSLVDEIAYPDQASPEVQQGVAFFSLMRNLTLSGYYTTEMGIKELGYVGNTPNVWDGVPEEVLKEHGLSYDPEWIARCVDQSKRMEIARWDEQGNLLT